jgi:hypothetical protein
MNDRWQVEHENDTGPGDEGYHEWWEVTDGYAIFRTISEWDAAWLRDLLNAVAKTGMKGEI